MSSGNGYDMAVGWRKVEGLCWGAPGAQEQRQRCRVGSVTDGDIVQWRRAIEDVVSGVLFAMSRLSNGIAVQGIIQWGRTRSDHVKGRDGAAVLLGRVTQDGALVVLVRCCYAGNLDFDSVVASRR